MNTKTDKLCKVAADALRLKNISLVGCRFELGDFVGDEGVREEKQGSRYRLDKVVDSDKDIDTLGIIVSLGIRIVSPESEDGSENIPFAYLIEADFLVEYIMNDQLDEDVIKAFTEINAVHNVWPFWRQHVFDIAQRANLPHIEVPLFTV